MLSTSIIVFGIWIDLSASENEGQLFSFTILFGIHSGKSGGISLIACLIDLLSNLLFTPVVSGYIGSNLGILSIWLTSYI